MSADKPESLIDSVYARVRDLILSNVFRAGEKLVDRDLASQLGVSRTPVREALGRLAMMGLVESHSRRGYYVRQYTAAEVADLYAFREILETSSARLAATNLTAEQEARFDRILEEIDEIGTDPAKYARSVDLDIEIHNLIAEASGNDELHKAVRNLMDKVMCLIWLDWADPRSADPESVAAAHDEHRRLILSIKARDPDAAATILRDHIRHTREVLTSLLEARENLRTSMLASAGAR